MCGRTACTLQPDEICKSCTYKSSRHDRDQKPAWRGAPGGQQYYPSHNIAPGSYTPVILSSQHKLDQTEECSTERVIQPMLWGLVPSWHKGSPKKVSYETNNCRSESMLQKPTYKVPLEKGRRCVVLADGFFEWKRDQSKKQPYFIYFPEEEKTLAASAKKEDTTKLCESTCKQDTDFNDNKSGIKQEVEITSQVDKVDSDLKDDKKLQVKVEFEDSNDTDTPASSKRLLTMAGVFDIWKPTDGSPPVYSYSVITVESSPAMMKVHHRMPALLLTDKEIDEWLDFGNVPLQKAVKNIRATETIQMHPVSDVVNNSRNKTPECTKPIDLKKPKTTPSSNLMMKWLNKGKKSDEPPNKKFKSESM